jgi:hypothetical protein
MNVFPLHLPVKNQKDEPGGHTVVPLHEDLHHIADGGEFLDDNIRMKEQPFILMRAEESIAPGSPDDLL